MEMGRKEEGAEATQIMGENGVEGTGERQRGWLALCLTMGALCSLEGAGTQGPVSVGAGREAWSAEFFPGKWGHLLGQ